jgi:hypothetical protein
VREIEARARFFSFPRCPPVWRTNRFAKFRRQAIDFA